MRILIIGAAGMVGRKLAEHLITEGSLGGKTISTLHAVDVVSPALTVRDGGPSLELGTANVASEADVKALVASKPDVIFHLAAIVSGEAEVEFEKGYAINLDGTRYPMY